MSMFNASSMLMKGNSKPYGPLRPMSYARFYRNVYLNSEHWINLRTEKINKNSSCEKCGICRGLDVHHINYRELYNVKLSDLKVLCRMCHEKEHRKIDKKKNKTNVDPHRKVKRINKDDWYWNELEKVKYKLRHEKVSLNPRNKKRQMEFDKKYPKIPYELSNYISIHY